MRQIARQSRLKTRTAKVNRNNVPMHVTHRPRRAVAGEPDRCSTHKPLHVVSCHTF